MKISRLACAMTLGATTLWAMPDVAPAVATDAPAAASMQPADPAKTAGGTMDSNRNDSNDNASSRSDSNRTGPNRNGSNRNTSNRKGSGLGAASAGNANERKIAAPASAVRGSVGPSNARPRTAERVQSNSERLRALSNQQAHARMVAPNRYSDTASRRRAAAATPLAAQVRGPGGANPAAPKMVISSSAMRTAQGSKHATASAAPGTAAANRGSGIGGAHVAGSGRLGGPASRTARNSSLDGTQVRHKF
jgi:hypothetical protein